MSTFTTFRELIEYRRKNNRDDSAYTFLASGEINNAEDVLYGPFLDRAVAIGTALLNKGYGQKQVLLIYQPGLAFVEAFLGCLWAGVVAVPLYPPQNSRSLERVSHVVNNCEPVAVIASLSLTEILAHSDILMHNKKMLPIWTNDSLKDESNSGELWGGGAQPLPEWTAFIQYTSGSTSDPKGVVLSHANILANQSMITHCFGHSSESVVVGWLPFYHDMGLIGNILQPLYIGCHCILMPALYVMQKPVRWLKAISHYKGTTSGGPDFGYELCLKGISESEMSGIDLSSWEVAFNGAEPVRASTLDTFTDAFGEWGFKSSAFLPCYGLAEASLIVSGVKHGNYQKLSIESEYLSLNTIRISEQGQEGSIIVSCGSAVEGTDIRIVNPSTGVECFGNEIGEIFISGPSMSMGYYNNEEVNKNIFNQSIVQHDSPVQLTGYLRTGDLGFLHDGMLYVTGRIKDVIIVHGKNHYPHDIERSIAEQVDWLYNDTVAVFSIPAEQLQSEGPGVLCELTRDMLRQVEKDESLKQKLKQKIVRIVVEQHHITPRMVTFVRPGAVPRTSSGKIRRNQCRHVA